MKSAALELLAKNNRLQETLQQLQAAQKKLVQSEKLAGIGRMAEGMCHEILNPLNNISGLTQAIEMEREKDEGLLKDMASVKEEIKRIETITSALTDFSAKGEAQLTPTNINEVIQQVLENLKNEGQLDNIEVHQELAPDLPDSYLDTHLMRQVFANLAANAKDAMPEDGTLTVSTELPPGKNKADNGGQIEGVFLRVKFSDTGTGIPKEHLGKIFDPFFSTSQDKTGMGLALCHSVIEKHEGSLTAVSNEGNGTTFIIDLPIRD
jgi:signal transduction histidine kinase